jgi:ketosteroid isomerase-like protein
MEVGMEGPSARHVVRDFYAALARRDAEALGQLIDNRFHPDAVLALAPSLPYGGRFAGAAKLRRMFVGAASSQDQVGPVDVTLTGLLDDGDRVAAELAFDWYAPGAAGPLASSAVEIWTFAHDLVTEIRAYYWDTAACADRVWSTQQLQTGSKAQ